MCPESTMPMRNVTHLRNESCSALRWLSSCFSHEQLRSVRQAPQLRCLAAADAMAEVSTVGIAKLRMVLRTMGYDRDPRALAAPHMYRDSASKFHRRGVGSRDSELHPHWSCTQRGLRLTLRLVRVSEIERSGLDLWMAVDFCTTDA